ncbi:alpha-L-fucosidase [Mucilaginibacter yixingensis]|uniref:alpha-L-fucosidase n=2 Tax=Mucilaginibacter yixingensis TaxID=1295612 RepID=A0A2T5JB65_9SPHI|nr:alpha-L-fucosidase [Mucilaginibacter yixingensis]
MKKMNFIKKSCYAATLLLLLAGGQAGAQQNTPADKMTWWKEAKFGMFIHWGVYAELAGRYQGQEVPKFGEWIMNYAKIPVATYQAYAKQFNPVKYNADAWVKAAKDAGMKYIIITAKHHDGFALFDSKVTDWDVVDATPYGKDLLAQLVAACHRHGMKIGFYYSQSQDWHHPGGAAGSIGTWDKAPKPDTAAKDGHWDVAQNGDYDAYLNKIAVPQVKELLSRYGNIDVLWWDTPVRMTPERAVHFTELLKPYPKLITNNRLGGGVKGDTETPEQFVPATGFPGRTWETCMTMNDTWGFKADDHNWKSSSFLIRNLIDIVSKGGNFLLNVGPTAQGEMPEPSLQRLAEVGKWVKANAESIYGTTASPFPYLSWGRATRKGQKLYLHVFDYPADGMLHVPMTNQITGAHLLAGNGLKLQVLSRKGYSAIKLPVNCPDTVSTVVEVDFKGEPQVLPLPMLGKLVTVSSQKSAEDKPTNISDLDPTTRWTAAAGKHEATVAVDLGAPVAIGSFSIDEPWHPWDHRSQQVQLEYFKNGQWVKATEVNTNGASQTVKMAPVTASKFRLQIKNDFAEPSLMDWQLYRAE